MTKSTEVETTRVFLSIENQNIPTSLITGSYDLSIDTSVEIEKIQKLKSHMTRHLAYYYRCSSYRQNESRYK